MLLSFSLAPVSARADAVVRSQVMFASTIAEYFVEEGRVRMLPVIKRGPLSVKKHDPPRLAERKAVGWALLALGIAVFAVRLQHDGAYAVPRGGNLFGGLGALLLGGMLVWSAAPRRLGWLALRSL